MGERKEIRNGNYVFKRLKPIKIIFIEVVKVSSKNYLLL